MPNQEAVCVYPEGEESFVERITLALIIKGVLNNDPESIYKALEILGRAKDSIDTATLQKTVFDLTHYTTKLRKHQKAS